MSSICSRCAYLIICEALHKDSIVECEDYKNNVQTNADRIRATLTSEELMDAIFHALKMSRQYTDSRRGMVDWLNETRWGWPTLDESEATK